MRRFAFFTVTAGITVTDITVTVTAIITVTAPA